jgi:hypothetical protein
VLGWLSAGFRALHRPSFLQHPQDPQPRRRCRKMFDGVAAYNMAKRKDRAVRRFRNLCQNIKADYDRQV